MADEQIVTNIVAKSDFSSLIADLHKVTASLSQLQQTSASTNKALASQIDAINRTFESNLRKTGQFSTHFVSLTSDVDKFGKNLDSGRLKLRDYFNAYQQHTRTSGGLVRDLAKQQVQLQNAILQPLGRNAQGLMQFNVHVPRGLDTVKNKTALAKQELQIMNKVIQDGGIQLINWGKNTQWAGRQLTVGLTLPIAAFGKAAADAFKQADQELTRLTKVYGDIAGTSAAELGKVRDEVTQTAKDLSAAMGVSFTETIALAADIAATGKTGNDLLSSVSETTRLAVLGEVDRQEAMKATLAIQTAFKQNNEELAASINFLNAVENQTSTTLNDLVEAIPKAGPVIQGLGGSVQDLALYLTAMREGGVNASEGANALKSALASLINPTDVAVAKFKGFGIDLMGIVNNNAGNVTKTLLALQSSLDKLNPLQKQQAIEQLFGKFQFSRLNALFENLGKQGSQTLQVLDLMNASAGELEAVAGRELAAVTESASGKYKRAIESLRANLSVIGEDFLAVGTQVVNVFNKILDVIEKLPDPIKKFVTLGGVFTAIAGPVIMLTGVMGNFIGYMIKGYGHIKAFLKGGEGFKLLTPEILATQQAAGLVEDAFYSDAKAASILGQALQALTADYTALNAAIAQGAVSTNPTIRTAGGNLVSGSRTVDVNHPLVGGLASAHLNPRDPNNPATIFGLVPQSDLVNQKIGRTPQIMMQDRLPDVEGLTTVKKTLRSGETLNVSTGVVAEEAARYQALIGTLGMQSQREVEALKDVISKGGQVSTEFMATFDDILPITQRLTTNAARESAAIVAQLQAGKMTVEAAKLEIIRVNAQLETMLGSEITAYAAGKGRSIDLTKMPLIDQPVVDPATGKSNARALTRRGRMRELMYSLGRATKTRMFGAPYSIETTKPPGFNTGGKVFYNNGDQVPGPNVNADVVPAMLTPGEFVIRRGVAQQDPDGMRALNEGRGMVVPIQRNMGGIVPGYINGGNILKQLLSRKPTLSAGSISGNPLSMFSLFGINRRGKFSQSGSFIGPRGGEIVSVSAKPATATYGAALARMPINPDTGKPHTLQSLNGAMARRGLKGEELDAYLATLGYMSQGGPVIGTTTQLLDKIIKDPKLKNKILQEIDDEFYKKIADIKKSGGALTDTNNPYHNVSNEVLNKYFAPGSLERNYWDQFKLQTSGLNPLYMSDLKRGAGHSSSAGARNVYITAPDGTRIKIGKVKGSGKDTMAFHSANKDWEAQYGFNSGGMVPGYLKGSIVKALSASTIKKITSKWGKVYDGDSLSNTDPLHGPLQIGTYSPPLTIRTRRQGATIGYRGGYVEREWQGGPNKGQKYMSPTRSSRTTAFLTGSEQERGRYVTEEYMRGNYDVLKIPGAIEAMRAWGQKATGTFHRGITLRGWSKVGGQMPPLPKWLIDDIEKSKSTGDYSNLIGKEFIMRRSSWSSNAETAKGFGDFNLTADVKNRNVTPASQMFPELDFMTPGSKVKVNESESIFGGKFRITGADQSGLKLETVTGPLGGKRALGGPVNAGMPYVVGENGPEVFVPRNSGGIIPRYNRGGQVLKLLSMLGIPIAGQALGNKIGGTAGSVVSNASWILPMLAGGTMLGGRNRGFATPEQRMGMYGPLLPGERQIGGMGKSIFAPKESGGWGLLGKRVGGLGPTLLKVTSLFTKLNVAVGLGTTAAVIGYKAWKNYQENQDRVARSFGMTAEQAKKAGLKYTDFNKNIKEAIENQKAMAERNRLVYESLTLSGTPLNLTIEQYKKLKAEVKKTMPDIIESITKMNNMEASDYAVKLKTQFMSYGDTVDEATKKVYALFAASDKKFMAGAVIAQKAFGSIRSASDAAAKSIDLYAVALEKANAKGQANAVNTAFMGIESAIENAIKNSKGQLTYYDAMKKTLDEINAKTTKQKTLTIETIDAIAAQNPELADVLTQTDTIVSAWAKYQLILKGVNLDLSALNANQAIAVNNAVQLISQTVSSKLISGSGILADENAKLKTLTAQYKALEKQAAGLSARKQIDSRKRIEQLQEELNLIKTQADERRKALQEEQENEDISLQLQKKQIEYQSMIAQGKTAEAAQAKIDMEGLINQRERLFANRAIDDAEKKASAPIEAEIKKLQKANQDAADAASLAADKLGVLGTAIEKLKTTISEVTQAMLNVILNKLINPNYFDTSAGKAALASLQKTLGSTGNIPEDFKPTEPPKVNPSGGSPSSGDVGNYTSAMAAAAEADRKRLYGDVAGAIEKGLAREDLVVTAQNVIVQSGALKNPKTENITETGLRKILNDSGTYIPPAIGNELKSKSLSVSAITTIVNNKGLEKGDKFTYNGVTYEVTIGKSAIFSDPRAKIVKAASGGYIAGPGTSTSDSIPARLSNGEYVFSAKAVLNAGGPVVMDNMHNALKSSTNFAMGGYVNPSFNANMKLPSFETGVNMLYNDTIAQLHKNEAVVPAEFNPWNPSASNPLGGTYTINNQVSVQAAPGMSTEDLANAVAKKIEIKNRETMAKIGINRSR